MREPDKSLISLCELSGICRRSQNYNCYDIFFRKSRCITQNWLLAESIFKMITKTIKFSRRCSVIKIKKKHFQSLNYSRNVRESISLTKKSNDLSTFKIVIFYSWLLFLFL